MKYTVLMMIEDDKSQTVEAKAFSEESANIYIYAESWQQAQELLTQGAGLSSGSVQKLEAGRSTAGRRTRTGSEALRTTHQQHRRNAGSSEGIRRKPSRAALCKDNRKR